MPEYEIAVSCKDLADKDLLSKSDPVLMLLEHVPFTKRFAELGKTELIKDCLNPQFAKKFRLVVQPNQNPKLRVAVMDIDNFENLESIADQEFIGRADFDLAELLTSPVFTASLGRSCGLVTLKTTIYDPRLDGLVTMEIGTPDSGVFLEIHRADHAVTVADAGRVCSAAYTLAHRTEVSHNGCFQPIKESLFTLCRGDPSRLLRVEYWRRCNRGEHKLLSSGHTCLADLQALAGASTAGKLGLTDSKGKRTHLLVKTVQVQPS